MYSKEENENHRIRKPSPSKSGKIGSVAPKTKLSTRQPSLSKARWKSYQPDNAQPNRRTGSPNHLRGQRFSHFNGMDPYNKCLEKVPFASIANARLQGIDVQFYSRQEKSNNFQKQKEIIPKLMTSKNASIQEKTNRNKENDEAKTEPYLDKKFNINLHPTKSLQNTLIVKNRNIGCSDHAKKVRTKALPITITTASQDQVYWTHSLTSLLRNGLQIFQDSNKPKGSINGYLSRHKHTLTQLIQIIADEKDIKVRINAVNIMFEMLVQHQLLTRNKQSIPKDSLIIDNFKTLVESLYNMDQTFHQNKDYQEVLPDIQVKLLQIIIALCSIRKFEKQLREIPNNVVQFLGELLTREPNKKLLDYLLLTYKLLCKKKKNCLILSTNQFYDALYNGYQLSKQAFIITSLLKLISRNSGALKIMVKHEKVIHLLIELVVCTHSKLIDKEALLTLLHRVAKNEYGRSLISSKNNFNKLYNYFTISKDNIHCVVTTYGILNRCGKQTVLLPIEEPKDLNLPSAVTRLLGNEATFYESRSDIESDDDSEDVDDSDSDCSNCSATLPTAYNRSTTKTDMKLFFCEFLQSENANDELNKLRIFKNGMENIEQNVHRLSSKSNLAYPDISMLEAVSDQCIVCSDKCDLPLKHLICKLHCIRSFTKTVYPARTVYDFTRPCQLTSVVTVPDNPLQFNSHFESGNLQKAIRIGEYEYNLLVSPDTLTSNGRQWFYFQVNNIVPSIYYRFNIINFTKYNNLYNEGMQPLMFSTKQHEINGTGWTRAGENIVYYGNNYTDREGIRQYKTLSFSILFQHNLDQIYLASHYPYTYTRLMITLASVYNHGSKNIYSRIEKLCNTVTNMNEVPLLTITAQLNTTSAYKIPYEKRPLIFLSARVHSGESNSSWIMEGIIKFLFNETDRYAIAAREHYIFKVIPMLNPEGVICGNSRTGITGVDLNRCWLKPNQITCPEIYYAKKLIEYAKLELKQPIAAFIDIHGHSKKRCFFFYGCNPSGSWNKNDKDRGDRLSVLRRLPKVVRTLNNNIRMSFCNYRISKQKESTARVVMWREFGIVHSLTLECSYSEGNSKRVMDTKMLTDIGVSLVSAFAKIAVSLYKQKSTLPSFSLDFRVKKNNKRIKKL